MKDDKIDIEERIKQAREERHNRDLRKQDMQNRELLGQCLKQLRVYLIGLSNEASIMAREAKIRAEYDEMHREERRMRKEQYPCEYGDEMEYEREFKVEWM